MVLRKYCSEIGAEDFDKEVIVAGWVQDIRKLGSIAFILLRDRTGTVQITALKKEMPELFNTLINIPRESAISVLGIVKESKEVKAGFEIQPKSIEYINRAKVPLPLAVADRVGVEFDTRFEHRFLDLRKPHVQALFKIRHTMLKAIREQLERENFIEVHTPKIIAAAAEGGTNLFPVQYFELEAFLAQSPQLYKQILMATGLDKVYEIAPCFRAEEHNTLRHLNEFISVDIEQAFADEEDVMQVLERLIRKIIQKIRADNKKELELLKLQLPVPEKSFKRVQYEECVKIAQSKSIEIKFGDDFSTECLKAIGEHFKNFYFITEWPTKAKPFYIQPFEAKPEICRAFDLMYKEKEITSGGERVHDCNMLRERLKSQNLNIENFKYYLVAFEYGMPQHAGWGLGVERALMILTNIENIRECALFPRDRTRLTP